MRKMLEYLDAGVKLGWLINPQQQQVEIYCIEKPIELRNLPTELSGEEILPGFSLIENIFIKIIFKQLDGAWTGGDIPYN